MFMSVTRSGRLVNMEKLRVLELYSGIGGMHYALKESRIPAQVVAAVDVNTTANEVYRHNFPNTPLWAKTIEGLTLDDFDRLDFDMVLMSPPCQPFTRIGLQGDVSDPRTKSFLYILHILPRLAKRPRFLLLENVKGFETSSARDALVKTLKDCGYRYQEFLLSPTCIGIPNSRLRYFLIARALPESFSFRTTAQVLEVFPASETGDSSDHTPNPAPSPTPNPDPSPAPNPAPSHTPNPAPSHAPNPAPSPAPNSAPSHAPNPAPSHAPNPDPSPAPNPAPSHAPNPAPSHAPNPAPSHAPNPAPSHAPLPNGSAWGEEGRVLYKMETARDLEKKRSQDQDESVRRIQEFLEQEEEEQEEVGRAGRGMGQYLLPPKTLLRYALLMDIVRPSCRRSVCFTKGYGHYVEGTGSVLQSCTDAEVEVAYSALDSLTDEQKLQQLSQLRLRYFSPREIANLMGFPSDFSFPEKTTVKQRYRVLGNSLNVHVVARLIALMVV